MIAETPNLAEDVPSKWLVVLRSQVEGETQDAEAALDVALRALADAHRWNPRFEAVQPLHAELRDAVGLPTWTFTLQAYARRAPSAQAHLAFYAALQRLTGATPGTIEIVQIVEL